MSVTLEVRKLLEKEKELSLRCCHIYTWGIQKQILINNSYDKFKLYFTKQSILVKV